MSSNDAAIIGEGSKELLSAILKANEYLEQTNRKLKIEVEVRNESELNEVC